jgi:hypothetical protein
MNNGQTKGIVGSRENIAFFDIKNQKEYDYDKKEKVKEIESVAFKDDKFYVLCNKKDNKLGLYLFIIDTSNPGNDCKYLLNWPNKLNISDANIFAMEEYMNNKEKRSLILSYKTVGINTFNVMSINLDTGLLEYWHESN